MVEDARQLMDSGSNGFGSSEFGAHAPVVVAKNRLVVMQRVREDRKSVV